nr:hypothetical protein [Tanacetum cinerariifolium]
MDLETAQTTTTLKQQQMLIGLVTTKEKVQKKNDVKARINQNDPTRHPELFAVTRENLHRANPENPKETKSDTTSSFAGGRSQDLSKILHSEFRHKCEAAEKAYEVRKQKYLSLMLPLELQLLRVYLIYKKETSRIANADFAEIANFLNANPIRYALTKRVKRMEKRRKSRTPQIKRRLFKVRIESSTEKSLDDLEDSSKQGRKITEIDQDPNISLPITTASAPITTAGVSVSTAEPSNPPTTTIVIEYEDLIIAQTLMKMRRVIMREASETTTRPTIPPQQKLDPKDKGKGKMVEYETVQTKTKLQQEQERLGFKAAVRLQAELDEEEKQRIAKVHELDSPFNVEEWEDIQARVKADEELVQRLQAEEREKYTEAKQLRGYSFDEIKTLFETTMRRVNTFVSIESEVDRAVPELAAGSSKRDAEEALDQGGSKRQKTGESS